MLIAQIQTEKCPVAIDLIFPFESVYFGVLPQSAGNLRLNVLLEYWGDPRQLAERASRIWQR